jgi:hypothetical protein
MERGTERREYGRWERVGLGRGGSLSGRDVNGRVKEAG